MLSERGVFPNKKKCLELWGPLYSETSTKSRVHVHRLASDSSKVMLDPQIWFQFPGEWYIPYLP